MVETQRYVRKPLYVDAVQVTEENFEEVALWCQGDIMNRNGGSIEKVDGETSVITINPNDQYIHVRVVYPKTIRQTQAYVGDWILYTEQGYKVYTPGAFESSWTKVE